VHSMPKRFCATWPTTMFVLSPSVETTTASAVATFAAVVGRTIKRRVVQFFVGKSRSQEEFFYTFNALFEAHKQVAITSDCFPKEMTGIEERLTGQHETASIHEFTYGVSHRGASVRIPWQVAIDKKGYIEDRRPNANMDPYVVTRLIVETVCGTADGDLTPANGTAVAARA